MLLDNNKKAIQVEHEKQTWFERLYWAVFQFFIQNILHDKIVLFYAALLVQKIKTKKKHDAGGLRWTKYSVTMSFAITDKML